MKSKELNVSEIIMIQVQCRLLPIGFCAVDNDEYSEEQIVVSSLKYKTISNFTYFKRLLFEIFYFLCQILPMKNLHCSAVIWLKYFYDLKRIFWHVQLKQFRRWYSFIYFLLFIRIICKKSDKNSKVRTIFIHLGSAVFIDEAITEDNKIVVSIHPRLEK